MLCKWGPTRRHVPCPHFGGAIRRGGFPPGSSAAGPAMCCALLTILAASLIATIRQLPPLVMFRMDLFLKERWCILYRAGPPGEPASGRERAPPPFVPSPGLSQRRGPRATGPMWVTSLHIFISGISCMKFCLFCIFGRGVSLSHSNTFIVDINGRFFRQKCINENLIINAFGIKKKLVHCADSLLGNEMKCYPSVTNEPMRN